MDARSTSAMKSNYSSAPQRTPPPGTLPAVDVYEPSDEEEEEEEEDGEELMNEIATQMASAGHPATPVATSNTRQSQVRLSPKRRANDHLKNVRQALKDWRYKTRRNTYKYSSLKAENILPDSNLSTIASHRRGVKTTTDLKRILKPPWPHVDIHGDDVLELVRSLDEAEDSRRAAAALKKREDRKAATAIRQAEAAARKATEREAVRVEKETAKLHRQWAQAVASYSGAMGPSAALNAPTTPTRPTGSNQYSPPSFSSHSFIPYTGYVFSPYAYSTPYGYAAPSSNHSEPAMAPPPVASSSASRIPKTAPSPRSLPAARHPYPAPHTASDVQHQD